MAVSPIRFFSLAVALLALGCAKNAPHPAPSAAPAPATSLVKVEPASSFAQALDTLSQSTLSCESPEACPAQVGMLLAADPAGGFDPERASVAACTAFLVGEDLALTNSHCIPSAVKLLPDLCAERVRLVLPTSAGMPEETFTCAALLGHSERATPMSPDLALLRLTKKTGRTPFATAREGVEPDSHLRAIRVNPSEGNRRGTLVTSNCKAVAHSYRMPVYENALSPAVVLGDCDDVPGNSGSPLVGEDGKVRGLLQASLPISEGARTEWSKHLQSPEGGIASLAMGTSLHCLSADPASGAFSWNASCATISEQDVLFARPRIRDFLGAGDLEREVAAILAPFVGQTRVFHWERTELENKPLDRRETIRPSCLAPSSEWRATFLDGEFLAEEADLQLQAPRLLISMRFSRFLQPLAPFVSMEESKPLTFRFSPRAAADTGRAILTPGSGEPTTLSLCPAFPQSSYR